MKFGQIRLFVMLHNVIPAKIIYIAVFMSKWHVDAFSPLSRIPATTLHVSCCVLHYLFGDCKVKKNTDYKNGIEMTSVWRNEDDVFFLDTALT